MSTVGPHTNTDPAPQRCPDCGQRYHYRIRPRLDEYSVGGAYRHQSGGWVYVHRINRGGHQ